MAQEVSTFFPVDLYLFYDARSRTQGLTQTGKCCSSETDIHKPLLPLSKFTFCCCYWVLHIRFVYWFIFKIEFLCIALAVLNPERSPCLCLSSTGIKGLCYNCPAPQSLCKVTPAMDPSPIRRTEHFKWDRKMWWPLQHDSIENCQVHRLTRRVSFNSSTFHSLRYHV